jgi:CxxC-x17-CxxC domain-containing protein
MADQQITCRDCNASFTFTEGEQAFYQERGLAAPQRCKDCRQKRKSERLQTRQMYPATCAKCGAACEVPFKPRPEAEGGRPVLCLACFKADRDSGKGA